MGMSTGSQVEEITAAAARERPSRRLARPAAPVIFVDGVLRHEGSWRAWLNELRWMDVPAIVAEVPGRGFATPQTYADTIERARMMLIERDGLDPDTRVSVIGFSAGGVGAVAWMRRHPEHVDRVVAVSSPLGGNEIATAATRVLGRMTPAWVRGLSQQESLLHDLDPELAQRVTSLVGSQFDGIVTARSGRDATIAVRELADLGVTKQFHPHVQMRVREVRHAAWEALA